MSKRYPAYSLFVLFRLLVGFPDAVGFKVVHVGVLLAEFVLHELDFPVVLVRADLGLGVESLAPSRNLGRSGQLNGLAWLPHFINLYFI